MIPVFSAVIFDISESTCDPSHFPNPAQMVASIAFYLPFPNQCSKTRDLRCILLL
jgi:hypothetical protein